MSQPQQSPLGVMFPMAFPGPGNSGVTLRGEAPGNYLLAHLQRLVDEGFTNVELTHIKDPEVRRRAAEIIRGLNITFAAQVVQLQNEDNLVHPFDISHPDEAERARAVQRIISCIAEAREIGARQIAMLSGRDPVLRGEGGEGARASHKAALVRSLSEIGRVAGELTVLLIPFDRRANPSGLNAFKSALIGPVDEAMEVIDRVREAGVQNVLLGHDTAHLLQNGEGPRELARVLPYLGGLHLSNCVLDLDAPDAPIRYGDLHPRFNTPGSAVTPAVLAEYARVLAEGNYAGPLTFEVKPVGNEDPWDVVLQARSYWREATNTPFSLAARPRGYSFSFRDFLPDSVYNRLTELRLERPTLAQDVIRGRKRAPKIPIPLVLLAADHPARMVTSVLGDSVRMGDRHEYIARIARVLAGSSVHGLMGTPDVIEEIALLDFIARENGAPSLLDGKYLVASVNRGGLAGLEHEMFDPATAYRDLKKVHDLGIDAVKYLVRFQEPGRNDRYSISTMADIARSMDQAHELGLPVFLEPLAVRSTPGGGYEVVKDPDPFIKVLSVASGMSSSSSNVWMKIPVTRDFHRVARACSHPILLLGGPPRPDVLSVIEDFIRAAGEAANVRGALVGRTLLYPGDEDPAAAAEALVRAMSEGGDLRMAARVMAEQRGQGLDAFAARRAPAPLPA